MLTLWHPQQMENFYRRVWSHPLNCLSTVVLSAPSVPGQYLSLLSRHHRPCALVSLPLCLSLLFPSSSSPVSLFISFCCSCPLSYPLPSSPLIPLSSSFPCVSHKNIFHLSLRYPLPHGPEDLWLQHLAWEEGACVQGAISPCCAHHSHFSSTGLRGPLLRVLVPDLRTPPRL